MSQSVTAALKYDAGEVTLAELLSQLQVDKKESEIIVLLLCSIMRMSR